MFFKKENPNHGDCKKCRHYKKQDVNEFPCYICEHNPLNFEDDMWEPIPKKRKRK